ncbi:MAG: hypothetical protein BZ137_04195 [Methanosphaera sp. rholeuAM130]|nr:KEOPS complex subunit Pcc1 [Methanosphaera sp.]RAP54078.1 MAG: hypothetical protein BZ137_04195 [Methanosphaera sp. rholeuAM130]
MHVKTKITFTYQTEQLAKIAYHSLLPDNENHIESYVNDNQLTCIIENENIGSVLNSIEDLIQCEKVIEVTSEIV